MIEQLIEMQWDQMLSLPPQRFFNPNERFWDALLKQGPDARWMDCGTGDGHIPLMAEERGITMSGCDVCSRIGQKPGTVYLIPAHRIPWQPSMWALVCRPNHGDWVQHLFDKVRRIGCGFVYVGLQKNIAVDLDEDSLRQDYQFISNVGEDGETMLLWKP